jgi:hypothetical protein
MGHNTSAYTRFWATGTPQARVQSRCMNLPTKGGNSVNLTAQITGVLVLRYIYGIIHPVIFHTKLIGRRNLKFVGFAANQTNFNSSQYVLNMTRKPFAGHKIRLILRWCQLGRDNDSDRKTSQPKTRTDLEVMIWVHFGRSNFKFQATRKSRRRPVPLKRRIRLKKSEIVF